MRIIRFPRKVYKPINPRVRLKPLAARLLAISNAISCRVDSLRRVKGEI